MGQQRSTHPENSCRPRPQRALVSQPRAHKKGASSPQVTTPGRVPGMVPHQLGLFSPGSPSGHRLHVGTVGGIFVDMGCCRRLLLVVSTGACCEPRAGFVREGDRQRGTVSERVGMHGQPPRPRGRPCGGHDGDRRRCRPGPVRGRPDKQRCRCGEGTSRCRLLRGPAITSSVTCSGAAGSGSGGATTERSAAAAVAAVTLPPRLATSGSGSGRPHGWRRVTSGRAAAPRMRATMRPAGVARSTSPVTVASRSPYGRPGR